MTVKKDLIKVAAETGKKILIYAEGNPGNIVAIGIAAGVAGIGYGLYEGSTRLLSALKLK